MPAAASTEVMCKNEWLMDNQIAAAARALGSQAAATIGLLGGLATLFYMSGFIYAVSYFAGIGAPWLVAETGVSQRIPGAVVSFAALFTILFILMRFRTGKLRSRPRLVWMATFCTVLSVFPLVVGSSEVTVGNHAALYTYAVIVAGLAGFAFFELSISYHLEKSDPASLHGLLSALAAICVVFVWIPALQGRAIALADLADPTRRLPTAIVLTNNVAKPVPVLLVTTERVFCLDTQPHGPPRLRPVSWAEIQSLSTRDGR